MMMTTMTRIDQSYPVTILTEVSKYKLFAVRGNKLYVKLLIGYDERAGSVW